MPFPPDTRERQAEIVGVFPRRPRGVGTSTSRSNSRSPKAQRASLASISASTASLPCPTDLRSRREKFYRQEDKQLAVFQPCGQKVRARALAAKSPTGVGISPTGCRTVSCGNAEISVAEVSPKLAKTRESRRPCRPADRCSAACCRTSRLRQAVSCASFLSHTVPKRASVCGCIPATSPKGLGAL